MATVHLIFGPVGSGKTTFDRTFAAGCARTGSRAQKCLDRKSRTGLLTRVDPRILQV